MPRIAPRSFALVAAGALLAATLALFFAPRPAVADASTHRIAFLTITGEGATARAWYKGAPPAGVPVQDALDTFAADGYRVRNISPSQRPIIQAVVQNSGNVIQPSDVEQYFIVLLERP